MFALSKLSPEIRVPGNPEIRKRLLDLIGQPTGKATYVGEEQEEGVDVEADADMVEARMVIPA